MVNFNLEIPNPETRHRIDINPLLFHLRYLAMKDYYIEAYKVLKDSKNNQDNIFLLLGDLANRGPAMKIKAEHHINELQKHNEIITRICNLRDKFYAHLDSDYENYIDSISVGDILKCFVAIESALITLSSEEILKQHLDTIVSRNEMQL